MIRRDFKTFSYCLTLDSSLPSFHFPFVADASDPPFFLTLLPRRIKRWRPGLGLSPDCVWWRIFNEITFFLFHVRRWVQRGFSEWERQMYHRQSTVPSNYLSPTWCSSGSLMFSVAFTLFWTIFCLEPHFVIGKSSKKKIIFQAFYKLISPR